MTKIWDMEPSGVSSLMPAGPDSTFQAHENGFLLQSDVSRYRYQVLGPILSLKEPGLYRADITTTISQGGLSLGILDLHSDSWIAIQPLKNGAQTIKFETTAQRVRLIIANHNPVAAQSKAHISAMSLSRFERGRESRGGRRVVPALENAKTLWGSASYNGEAGELCQDGRTLFPEMVATGLIPDQDTPWRLTVKARFDRTLSDPDLEDVGLIMKEGRLQAWWGAPTIGGTRVTLDGQQLAEGPSVLPAPDEAGAVRTLVLDYSETGALSLSVDGRLLLSVPLDMIGGSSEIILATRSQPVCWSALRFDGRALESPTLGAWTPVSGEPVFDKNEAVSWGVQPLQTHLWNRWTGSVLRAYGSANAWPFLNGDKASPITHGPLLGLPAARQPGVLIRSVKPLSAEIIGGPSPDPETWRVLGGISTSEVDGNTGHALFPSVDRDVYYSLRIDGEIVDWRLNGEWPVIQAKWFRPETKSVSFAVMSCDNMYPVPDLGQSKAWPSYADRLDFGLHLGDYVYEQSWRRRASVSHLDYQAMYAPQRQQALRAREVPIIGLFDDHEMFNDITGTGELHRFENPPKLGNVKLPQDMPWRIMSRDVGRGVFEDWIGWGTPTVPGQSRDHFVGKANIVNGEIQLLNATVPDSLADTIEDLAPLIIWPEGRPNGGQGISPANAGLYEVVATDASRRTLIVEPKPSDRDGVTVSLSPSRYFSMPVAGGNARIIGLDTRTDRTFWREDADSSDARIMSTKQFRWLLDEIANAQENIVFIATASPVTFHNGFNESKRDSWTGYQNQRDHLLRALANRRGKSIILSGDLHNGAVRQINENIYEVLVGSWSNAGFCPVDTAAAELADFPNAKLLWHGPTTRPDCDWLHDTTFVEMDENGRLTIDIVDVVSGALKHRLELNE